MIWRVYCTLVQGITKPDNELRSPPSRCLIPWKCMVVHRVEGWGFYHYAVQNHKLELMRTGDFDCGSNYWTGARLLGQASVCFILGDMDALESTERTYRYVLMEAGHLGQNLYLAATSLGLPVRLGFF